MLCSPAKYLHEAILHTNLKRPKVMKPMAVASGTVVYFEWDPERWPQPKSGLDSAKERRRKRPRKKRTAAADP